MQLKLTPKALANLSPWLERSDNHGKQPHQNFLNPARVPPGTNPFRVQLILFCPYVLLLQLRLKIREIEVFSIRLNFPLLVDLEDADPVYEEDISRLGLKT